MADRLNGYRILILETREEAQFSRLLTEQGADVLQCPMFAIEDASDPAPIEAWIRHAIDKPFDDIMLHDRRRPAPADEGGAADRGGTGFHRRTWTIAKIRTWPQTRPSAARNRAAEQQTTEKPTSEGIAEMLSHLDLKGHRLGLQLYPRQGSQRADRRDIGARR